jgi:hypothetical protein
VEEKQEGETKRKKYKKELARYKHFAQHQLEAWFVF